MLFLIKNITLKEIDIMKFEFSEKEINTMVSVLEKLSDEGIDLDSLETDFGGVMKSVKTSSGGLDVDFDADLFAAAFELYGDLIAKMMTACEDFARRFEGIVKIAQTKAAAEKKAAEDAAEIENLKAELAKAKANAEA